eukprot:maker-scaffold_54-snap-gene-1.17-mRNA-1 protein AED:0.49 eAED:0.49 QI:0/0/0/0.66/0/0/3/0/115
MFIIVARSFWLNFAFILSLCNTFLSAKLTVLCFNVSVSSSNLFAFILDPLWVFPPAPYFLLVTTVEPVLRALFNCVVLLTPFARSPRLFHLTNLFSVIILCSKNYITKHLLKPIG